MKNHKNGDGPQRRCADPKDHEPDTSVAADRGMAMQAEIVHAIKDKFLSNVSHEIRTHLNGILGTTGLLLKTKLDLEQREYTDMLRSGAEDLLGLMNDLLDFCKLEGGEFGLEDLHFDLRTTMSDLCNRHAAVAREKGLSFSTFISPDVPSLLEGDPGRLRQVLTHLITNAIKFTYQGGVTVGVETLKDNGEVVLRFSVTDTGVGIRKEESDLLAKEFNQFDTAVTHERQGAGLGLVIAKRICTIMGGRMGFKSEEGKGTTFWFSAVLAKQTEMKGPLFEHAGEIQGTHVLVVDDTYTNRFVLGRHLESWRCRHDEARDGESALAKLEAAVEKDPFVIAIIDREMPGMDGETLGRKVKENDALRGTSLVMMTSSGSRGDAARVEKIGFSAYLTKPIMESRLRECLALLLAPEFQAEGAERKPFLTRHTVEEERKRRVRILVAEDNLTTRKLALRILSNMGYRADAVPDGSAAVEALTVTPYDLVLMDVKMPVMSGFEATAKIRDGASRVWNHNVPIIAITSCTAEGDRERCLAAGMNDYIPKPVRPEDLAESIGRYLSEGGGPDVTFPAWV